MSIRSQQAVCLRISGGRELGKLIEHVSTSSRTIVGADRVTFWMLGKDQRTLVSLPSSEGGRIFRLPFGRGLVGACAQMKQVIITADAYRDPLFDQRDDKRRSYHTVSELCLPILHDNELIGVVQASNRLRSDGVSVRIPLRKGTIVVGEFAGDDVARLREVANLACAAFENARHLQAHRLLIDELSFTLADAISVRDTTTGKHIKLVTVIAVGVAREMGLSEDAVQEIKIAAALHDIGKIGIRDHILLKPVKFTQKDYRAMKTHAHKGRRILRKIDWPKGLEAVPYLVGSHHELCDGSGYPAGLTKDEISLSARIITASDIFAAIAQKRPYKKAYGPHYALKLCRHEARNGKLDPKVVRALARVIEHYGFEALERRSSKSRAGSFLSS